MGTKKNRLRVLSRDRVEAKSLVRTKRMLRSPKR